MQSSPPQSSDGKARAIRALSASLNHSSRSLSPVLPAPSDSNPTQHSGFTNNTDVSAGSWDNNDLLHSTQHNFVEETNNTLPQHTHYPRMRSTAKKTGAWQPMRSDAPNVDTSMVNKEFGDFDSHPLSDEDDFSIEQSRALPRSNRSTPAKLNNNDFNSLYDMTPPSGRPRKSLGAETGSLRRDAQIRRASRNDLDMTVSPRPTSMRNSPAVPSQDRRRTSLAQLHAKVSQDESSMFEERPPTLALPQGRGSRWGNPTTRHSSLQVDGAVDASPRTTNTPRSRPATATQNPTVQSFILPDLPNLTELVSGIFEDGTPVISKTTAARSRFRGANNGSGRPSNFIKVDSVPIAPEEKQIFAALQLLQDKVELMERERTEAEKKIESQELEIIELKATTQAQERLTRNSSALGSTDSEKGSWKVEKTRLQATVQTLRTKLDRIEGKNTIIDIEKKRLVAERDNLAQQLSVAYQTCDELKVENEGLHSENDGLCQEIDSLHTENEALRDRAEHEEAQHREETVQLRRQVEETENATQRQNGTLQAELNRARDQLRRQVDKTDNATQRENLDLHNEVARLRARYDEHTQQLTRNDVELRKARREQAEYARLKADHEDLRAQLANLKSKREEDLRQWANSKSALKSKVERRDETISRFQDMTQEHTNDAMRLDNENLRQELAELTTQHEEDQQRWSQKENSLKRQVSRFKEQSDVTRDILNLREANGQQANAPAPATASNRNENSEPVQRRSSYRREENTLSRIRKQVQGESRTSRANASFQESHIEESPRNPYVKISRAPRTSLPSNFGRSVSSPVPQQKTADVESEAESTTDISLAPRTAHSTHDKRAVVSRKATVTTVVQPPPDMDITNLSTIETADIAKLRRQLEEDLIASRGRAVSVPLERTEREDTVRSERQTREDTVRSERQAREDTVRSGRQGREDTTRDGRNAQDDTGRSIASARSARRPSLPRKSSMKEATTTKTNITQFEEDLTGNVSNIEGDNADPTDASMLSNTSRRRRSAPTEMTSAFILPDLRIESRRQSTAKLNLDEAVHHKRHDDKNCTVCHPDATTEFFEVPKLIPVSSRMPDEPDATLRPSRSPADALALVVKGLCDERYHLHLELSVSRVMLEQHDPSLGRKIRLENERTMVRLLTQIRKKDDQIYNLYDALEGQKVDITEQFVEDVTEDLRKEAEGEEAEKKKGKKVTIQSFHEDEESEGEEELPWEGFEDTGERDFTGDARRMGVY